MYIANADTHGTQRAVSFFMRFTSAAQFAIALTALSLVVANPTLAFAQTDPAIEADHQVGLDLRSQHRDEEARVVFLALWTRSHEPRALARLALAENAVSLNSQAEIHLIEALSYQDDVWIRRNYATLAPLLQHFRAAQGVSVLTVQSPTPDAVVFVNGHNEGAPGHPMRVRSGTVIVEVRASRFTANSQTVQLAPGASTSVEIALFATPVLVSHEGQLRVSLLSSPRAGNRRERLPVQTVERAPPPVTRGPPPPPVTSIAPMRALSWTTAGLALGALGVGIAARVAGTGPAAHWNGPSCAGMRETGQGSCQTDLATARRMATVSGVGFVLAGAFAITSVVLFVVPGITAATAGANRRGSVSCAPGLGLGPSVGLPSLSCVGTF